MTALLELVHMPRSTYYYYVKKSKEPDKYANIKMKYMQFIMKIEDDMDIAGSHSNYRTEVIVSTIKQFNV